MATHAHKKSEIERRFFHSGANFFSETSAAPRRPEHLRVVRLALTAVILGDLDKTTDASQTSRPSSPGSLRRQHPF
jgi:hypothetical protein